MSVNAQTAADEIPLFSECVLGYRAWAIDEQDRLWPISDHRMAWEPGINTARCNCAVPGTLSFDWSMRDGRRVLEPHPPHAAPSAECTCGLYSWRRPRAVWKDDERYLRGAMVCGAVASWGQLQVHGTGFRAEHACVVTLAYAPQTGPAAMQKLTRVAERYRVELVSLDHLEEAASRHGTPLPDSLGPEDDPRPEPQHHLSPELDEAGRAALLASRHPELAVLEPIPTRDRVGITLILVAATLMTCGGWMVFAKGTVALVGLGMGGAGFALLMFVVWWLDPQRLAGHAARHATHHARNLRDRTGRRKRRHPKPAMTDAEFEAVEDALEPLEKYGSGLEGVTDPFRGR